MFGIDWNDPQVFWLNVTNLSLGVVTLICVLVLGFGIAVEVRNRIARRAGDTSIDNEVKDLIGSFDGGTHAFEVPGLGLTMADGGEPVKENPASPHRPGKTK